MHGQIAIGAAASLASIAVHAAIMALLIWTVHRAARATLAMKLRLRLMLVMMATVAVLMMAHLAEIGIWGLVYATLGVTQDPIGPFAAMNGVLLFGWSTAVIFDVLRTLTRAEWSNVET
jgi:hypothetical protein